MLKISVINKQFYFYHRENDRPIRSIICLYLYACFSRFFVFSSLPISFNYFLYLFPFIMKVDIIESLRRLLFENEEPTPTPIPTPTPSQIIVKPKKTYITASEILDIFSISKEVYNNLLVRQDIFYHILQSFNSQ